MEGRMGQHLTSDSGPFNYLENTSDLPGYSFGILLWQTKKKKIYLSFFPSPLTHFQTRLCLQTWMYELFRWAVGRTSSATTRKGKWKLGNSSELFGCASHASGFQNRWGDWEEEPPFTGNCRAEGRETGPRLQRESPMIPSRQAACPLLLWRCYACAPQQVPDAWSPVLATERQADYDSTLHSHLPLDHQQKAEFQGKKLLTSKTRLWFLQ